MNYRRVFIKNTQIFITIVTNKRRKILIDNIDLLRQSFKFAKEKNKFDIEAIVILPEHIHMIIKPAEIDKYPEIIKLIKTYFSRNMDADKINDYNPSKSRVNKKEKDIWQRRYWEHTIKSEEDLFRHIDYIHFNPIKHGVVKRLDEWKFSTFKKYVKLNFYDKNWCNINDENNIYELNYE